MGSYEEENLPLEAQTIPTKDATEPIAIIGFSMGFPQDATSSEAFWNILMKKRNTATEFPKDRMNTDAMYHPDANRRGQISVAHSHFLRDDIAYFDAPFFATSTTDAAIMDPQQRLLLEYTYKALENAGQPMETISGSKTSVYSGSFSTDWMHLAYKDGEQCGTTTALGCQPCFNANRISWFFNLTGNSANVDTACSSGLVALDLGCQGLRSGDEDMSIVAGSNLILSPDNMHALTNLNMLSLDGQCYSFDHRGNGYSRGEGFGVLILKRALDAIRDHDTIRGIIRSTGCNQDGHTPSITMPSSLAQETLIQKTYKKAGLSMEPTRFFEAHGTGTPIGDPIESRAVGSAFRQHRSAQDPLWVGAVKSNIGHLEGASGIAGVIKALLVLEKGIIPPNTNFEKANLKIDMDHLRIQFPLEPMPWPTKGLRRASVNSFGNGGTNAHVVLDDVLHFLEERGLNGRHTTIRDPPTIKPVIANGANTPLADTELAAQIYETQMEPNVLVFSTYDAAGIKRQAREYTSYFSNLQISPDLWQTYLNDLAYTLFSRRSSLPWKAFAVVKSMKDLRNLEKIISPTTKSVSDPRLGFIFTGQGAQWVGMGRELTVFPVFQRSLLESQQILLDLGCSWKLCNELLKNDSSINRPDLSQSICTAIQIALVDLLRQLGIYPTTVIGHSSGEIAAAYSAGAISAASAMRLAYFKGKLASSLATSKAVKGGMISVGLSKDQIVSYLKKVANQCGHHGLTVACINSPRNVTISGDDDQISLLRDFLEAEEVFTRKLLVDVAYHSSHMQAIAEEYCTMIQGIENGQQPPRPVTMISSVTGEILSKDSLLSPRYWISNLVSPVQFVDAVQNLFSRSGQRIRKKLDLSHRNYFHISMLVEIGPHPVLQGPINDISDNLRGAAKIGYTSLLTRKTSALDSFFNAMGSIHSLGYTVNLDQLNRPNTEDREPCMTLSDLPEYVFDHSKQHWSESRLSARYRLHHQGKLDLLGKPVADWNPREPRWRNMLRLSEMPWMEDHVVNGSLIYPGAGMVVMAIEAANQISDDNHTVVGFEVKEISFMKSLKIPQSSGGIETQLSLRITQDSSKSMSAWSEFRLYAYEQEEWIECCNGFVRVQYEPGANEVSQGRENIEELKSHRRLEDSMNQSCKSSMDPEIFYDMLKKSGLVFGPSFHRVIDGAYGAQNQVKGTIKLFEWPERECPQTHIIHPTSLDAIFHLAIAGHCRGGTRGIPTMVPTFLRRLFVSKTGLQFSEGNDIHECAWTVTEDNLVVHFDGFALDPSRDNILAQFEDLKVTKIAEFQEGPGNTTESQAHQKSYNIDYRPDPDLLDPMGISSYCQRTLDSNNTPFDRYLYLLGHKNSNLKILEIGTVNNDFTFDVLRNLSIYDDQKELVGTKYGSYCFTADDRSVLDEATANFQEYQRVTFEELNIQKDPIKQGFETGSYEVILALHTLQENSVFLSHIKKIMKPDGKLIFYEPDQSGGKPIFNYVFNQLSNNGFTDPGIQFPASRGSTAHVHGIISRLSLSLDQKRICIVSDPTSISQVQSAKKLEFFLESRGYSDIVTTNLADALSMERPEEIVFVPLIELGFPFLYSISQENFYLLKQFLIRSENVLWVNSYGNLQPEYALMQGLARVLRSECDNHRLTIISFELHDTLLDWQVQSLIEILIRNHIDPSTGSEDLEYLEIEGSLHIPRIITDQRLSHELQMRSNPQRSSTSLVHEAPPLKMVMGAPGLLDTLHFVEDKEISEPLADDEVEIETRAIGMNFKDCLIALGQISNAKMGQECAGVVTRAGSNTQFQPGERVILIAYEGYKTFTRGKGHSVYRIPDDMPFTSAAAIPAQFGTAWGVIHGAAQLQSHESILIHAAAGGTGQAAIQLAKLIGATIFATVGSQSKKRILIDEYQIPEEHIFYSRDVSFAKGIKRLTGGRGVDVVINSLVGDGLIASWECMAPCGRFVEIGKKDIMSNSSLPMSLFAKNVSFTGFDGNLWEEHNQDIEMLIDMFANKTLHLQQPFLIQNLSRVEEVFKTVQEGKFAGKIVVEVTPDSRVPTMLDTTPSFHLNSNATYVIAGGFGGIGRSTARWMASRGARNFILLSRYGPRTTVAHELLEELRGQGIRVEVPACDITNTSLIREVFENLSSNMPPIKGCLQASILAKDGLFKDMEYDSWKPAVDCKAIGSWNLHSNLPSGMDFFVILASASGLAGLRGQTNYNAGNTYEDALARYRVSQGEKAVSLDLGAMIDDGILAENPHLLDRVLGYGTLEPISRQKYFSILDFYCNPSLPLLSITKSQVAIGLGVGGGSGLESFDFSRTPMLYPLILENSKQAAPVAELGQANYREMLAASVSLDEASEIIIQAVVNKLAKSLSALQDSTSIDTHKPLRMYGVDSLLAIELRNWVVKEFVADIAVFETQGASTLETLSRLVAGRSTIKHEKWTIWGKEEDDV